MGWHCANTCVGLALHLGSSPTSCTWSCPEEGQKHQQNRGGCHPAVIVLKAGPALGKPPLEMSLCLALLRQGRELDLAACMGTFEFCTVVGTALTVVLFSRRVAFLLRHGPLLLPTVGCFF